MIWCGPQIGYALRTDAGDWKLVRFESISIQPQDIPCASWRLAAEQAA